MAKLLSGLVSQDNVLDIVRQLTIKVNSLEDSNRVMLAKLRQDIETASNDITNRMLGQLTDASYTVPFSGHADSVPASGIEGLIQNSQIQSVSSDKIEGDIYINKISGSLNGDVSGTVNSTNVIRVSSTLRFNTTNDSYLNTISNFPIGRTAWVELDNAQLSTLPDGTNVWGWVMVSRRLNYSGDSCVQTFFRYWRGSLTNEIWQRTYNNGSWTAWERFAKAGEVQALNPDWTVGYNSGSFKISYRVIGGNAEIFIRITGSGSTPDGNNPLFAASAIAPSANMYFSGVVAQFPPAAAYGVRQLSFSVNASGQFFYNRSVLLEGASGGNPIINLNTALNASNSPGSIFFKYPKAL